MKLLARSLVAIALGAATILSSLASAAPPAAISEIETRSLKFPFGKHKVRGVNLGGWLVLEPWITPSIFKQWEKNHAAVDEYTMCKVLGKQEAARRLHRHWSTWITRDDMFDIASKGLNFVRIPIGYWAVFPNAKEPYVHGAYAYLNQALDWANEAGLKVMIDLHGAPRSQNGFDNSGRAGPINWQKGGSVGRTVKVLTKIRNDHASHPAVASIQLVNEPKGDVLDVGRIKKFYLTMYKKLQRHNVAVAIHDAFIGVNSWNNFGKRLHRWLLDTHHYELFSSSDLEKDVYAHVGTVCSFGGQMSTNNKITISGEWTGAMTDCAKHLNGLGYGARYDGTFFKNGETSYRIGSCKGLRVGTVRGMSASYKANMRQYIEASMDGFEQAGGWIWWTWKTESAPEWNFKALANAGIIPQPLNQRQYGAQCG